MPAMTVTATPSGGTGSLLDVRVFTNAIEAGGASVLDSAKARAFSITPNASKSFLLWGMDYYGGNTSFTPTTSNVMISNIGVTSVSSRLGIGKYNPVTTGGTAVNVGVTSGTDGSTYAAVYEVESVDGVNQPAVDASTPTVVSHTSGAAPVCTTASFTPPAGAVLVATMVVGGNTSSLSWSITDTAGLVWTKRNDTGTGVVQYTATIPPGPDTGTGSVSMGKMGLAGLGKDAGTGSIRLKKMGLSGSGRVDSTCFYTFEGGTDGAAIAAGDTGSGTPFDSLGGSTTLPVYSSAGAQFGNLGASTPLSGNSTTTIEWTASSFKGFNANSVPWYGRDYFKITTLPSTLLFLMKAQDDTVPQDIWAVGMTTAGKLCIRNRIAGTTPATATTSVTTNSRNRYEFECTFDGSTYSITLWCFYGANADGATPDETLTASVTSADVVDVVAWGAQTATVQTWSTIYHDGLRLSTKGPIGAIPSGAATGAVRLKKMRLSGSGTIITSGDSGTGSIRLKKMGLSGTAKETDAGSGSVRLKKMRLSSSGGAALRSSGSIRLKKMGLSGIARETEFGTGSVRLKKMGLSGSGQETDAGTGSIRLKKMHLSGSGQETDSGTGSVRLHKMGLSSAGGASLRSTGSIRLHKMALSGSGQETDFGTGSVRLKKMGLSGSGTETGSGIGSVRLKKMHLSGSGQETDRGTGSVRLHKMGLSGSGTEIIHGTGSVSMHKMGLHGASSGHVTGTGSVSMHKMGISGSGTETDRGTGSVHMHKMSLSGSAALSIRGTGTIHMKKMGFIGSAKLGVPGTGAVTIPKMRIRGANFHKGADSLFIFTAV